MYNNIYKSLRGSSSYKSTVVVELCIAKHSHKTSGILPIYNKKNNFKNNFKDIVKNILGSQFFYEELSEDKSYYLLYSDKKDKVKKLKENYKNKIKSNSKKDRYDKKLGKMLNYPESSISSYMKGDYINSADIHYMISKWRNTSTVGDCFVIYYPPRYGVSKNYTSILDYINDKEKTIKIVNKELPEDIRKRIKKDYIKEGLKHVEYGLNNTNSYSGDNIIVTVNRNIDYKPNKEKILNDKQLQDLHNRVNEVSKLVQ